METNHIFEIYSIVSYSPSNIDQLDARGMLKTTFKKLITDLNECPDSRYMMIIKDSAKRDYVLISTRASEGTRKVLSEFKFGLGKKLGEINGSVERLNALPELLGRMQ